MTVIALLVSSLAFAAPRAQALLRNAEGKKVGTALVLHADPDDLKSDPAGNSGARIACGVIRAKR